MAMAPKDAAAPTPRRRSPRSRLALLRRAGYAPDLRLLGRTLVHAAVVGLAAGLVGALFVGLLELAQHFLLERLCGYKPLRAGGEPALPFAADSSFRPWLLVGVPALGALVSGWLSRYAPETRGGGGDALIESYHERGGRIRRRVAPLKLLASLATLGSGGSGGREGPTMQIGGSLGSWVAEWLEVSPRERRLLVIAGVAAGVSAVFRTPLGAALLAVEVLYRDDFEAEALVPAVLASVIAFAITTPLYGRATLFTHEGHFPFLPAQLPLYLLLALVISGAAALFIGALRTVQRVSIRLPGPAWARAAYGGLALGLCAVPAILYLGAKVGVPGQGLGMLGGGYGAAQVAIGGSGFLPPGWDAVKLLLALALAKLVATALTIGSGGSAGDFAPSLVLGGLVGGAFGHAAQLVTGDPSIDPGAFALVGMGTFYGGIAHVPLSALVLVSELAGSYELLVPLMLCVAVAFLLLRKLTLYESQPRSRVELAGTGEGLEPLAGLGFTDLEPRARPLVFQRGDSLRVVLRATAEVEDQELFPVVDAEGRVRGAIRASALRFAAARSELLDLTTADDLAGAVTTLEASATLRAMAERLLEAEQDELIVLDSSGGPLRIVTGAELFELQWRRGE
jgi:CIC family chloride channel protein